MVVDQKLLNSKLMKYNIGANVFNKLTGQQAQTPVQQTTPTVQPTSTPTDTQLQSRGFNNNDNTRDTITVKSTKFPTYDIKDIMGFSPTNTKNRISFAQNMNQYNKLQQEAQANTNPNIRYEFNKPQLTNKETLQLNQEQPLTNDQGLKINKTASFDDLISDLKYVASQGKFLSYQEVQNLYPEYVDNWDNLVDLFDTIKANPQYDDNKIKDIAQKQYPELFGINDNYSDSDKMSALKRLYDEMVSNKQNGIQLTQQDIIDRYPEYANTEDINTVMELQDFINKDKKSTPTFIDVYDISDQFKSLTKGNTEYGNAEQNQISSDLKSLDNIDANIYNYLSEEGQDYVKTLALAKEIGDMVRKDYRVPDNISDYDLLMKVKDEMPEVYSELTKGLNITNEISDYDRKIFEGKTTGKKFAQQSIKKIGGNLMAVLGPDAVKGLGILSNRLGDLVESGYTGISNKLENATGNRGIFENTEGISEGSHALGDTLIRASGWLKEDLESQDRYQEFLQEQGAEKAKGAGINFKGYKNALKEGDMKGIRDTFVKDVNEAKDLGWGTWLSKNLGSLGYLLPSMFAGTKAEMFLSFLPSGVGRAYEDYANDEGIKANLTDKQIQDRAILAGGLESLIEVMETPFRKGKRGSFMENFPGMRNAIVRTIMMTEKGAVGEGLEEVAQEFSNRLIAKASGSERDLGTLDEYLDIFAETVSSSQIVSLLGGSAEGIDQQKLNNLEQQIAEDTEYRNKILEGQAFVANDFNEFASAVEVVPGTTTEELQQVWNNAQQKKQDLEQKTNNITSNSYNNVNVPTYERTTVKENEQPKLSAKDSQEYTDLLDEMEKNGEITKEDRKKVETELGIFTRNVEQPKTEGLANIQKTNETKSETSTEEKRNIIDRIVDKGASIVTKTASAQDKLYKAQEPRMNVLSNKKNLEKRRANSDRANELIVENGYKPTNTEERLNAHQATLNKLWDQVKEQVKQGEGITVDQTPIINALSEYISEKKKLGIAGIESEIKALERELNAMKKSQEQGKTDLPVLEQKKQVFNDMIDWKEQEASEVYKGGLRLLTHEIGKVEDDLISKIPGEFTKLKQDVGALLDTYEDVFKAHMKNQRSKGIGLTETYSRIEGIGDMLQGIIGVFKGEGGKVISGAGKVLLGKSLARAKDVDFLIKKGFEELSNEMGSNNKNDNDTTTDKNDNPPTKPNKPKNNQPKDQSPSETEKKSEKKTDKAEQVQGMAKISENNTKKNEVISENQKRINELWNVKEENGVKYIEIDGKKIYNQKKSGKINNRKRRQHQFTNKYIFDVKQQNQNYLSNLSDFIKGNGDNIQISDEYSISRDVLNHIYEDHGAFAPENLIETVNDYDDIVYSPKGDEGVNYLLKKIPGSTNYFRAVVSNDGVLTFFERVVGDAKAYKNELLKGTKKDGDIEGHPSSYDESITKKSEKSIENNGLAKVNETKEQTKVEGLVKIDETKSQSESKIDNRVQEQPLFNVETKQEGLAAISVKVENGKVVKESETEQESEIVETPQEFEVLPADVSVYDESKTTGPKRISPDRGGWWQQLTPKEAIDKKIEQITKDRQRRTEQYDKKLDILNGYIEKFGDSISQNDRSKEATEARKTIRNEIINPYRLGNFFTAGALGQIKEVFERWKSQQNTEITDKNREDINRDYIQHVKEDISHGYRYPEAVLSYNPEFRTAVDNRARYEKGLYTSFSTDDTRIVDYKKDQIGAGMKRQDGKELTQEQKDEIANGVINYQETMGIDIKRLAENNNWVYVHLNGKNPFLMGSQGGIAGLYRGSVDEKGRSTASISVGGTESYQIREDGKIVTKKKKTTMAHELTHALDALSSRKLLSESAYNDLRLKFNDYDSRGLHRSSYWTSKSEITARMVEEYVAVQNGDTEIFNEKGYWDQETYNSVIEPEINKIKNNFFQEYKEGIGGDSIEQIKADAIIRGLAEISNF